MVYGFIYCAVINKDIPIMKSVVGDLEGYIGVWIIAFEVTDYGSCQAVSVIPVVRKDDYTDLGIYRPQ